MLEPVLALAAGLGLVPAYIDPGTGAMLWQLLAAASVGLLFYVRRFRDWVLTKLRVKKPVIDESRE